MTDYSFSVPVDARICPACGELLQPEGGKLELPGAPSLDEVAHAVSVAVAERLEERIIDHYTERHRLRYWLWCRLRWGRILG